MKRLAILAIVPCAMFAQRVAITDGAGGGNLAGVDAGGYLSANVGQWAGTAVDTNSGAKSAGTLRVVLATDQPQLTNALKVDGSGVTQPVSGTVTTTPPANASTNVAQVNGTTTDTNSGNKSAGTLRVVIATDQPTNTSNLNVAVNAALPAGAALIGEVAPVATATTTDAASTSATQSTASTNATSVKGSAGNVYGIYAINTTATLYYLRMYNSASSPTCSSATGFIETIPVPASATGAGIARMQWPQAFATGIGFCLTGGGSSTDNTNAATGVYVTVLYK